MQVFVGHDWAEDHHDIEIRDGEGRRLGRARLPEGVEGVARFHALVAEHVEDPAEVVIATETALQLGELYGPDALGVLAAAPTPSLGRTLSRKRIASAIARAGRQRRLEERAEEIQAALRAEQLATPAVVSEAMGASVAALVAVIGELNTQIDRLEAQLSEGFDQHPDAKIVRSLPGLGTVLGARVLAEFGDDPNRYSDAEARKNYTGTSPITKASGKSRVVLSRDARNRRLSDACYLWAFAALTSSPGTRAFYDVRRAGGDTHNRALRALANRLVGILHGCLRHQTLYDEHTAWAHRQAQAA